MATFTQPNYLFETSWEVCNKIGGIYTVIATKAPLLCKELKDKYITVGPDVWIHKDAPDFTEDKSLFPSWRKKAKKEGLRVRIGRWNIQGSPIAFLVDFSHYINEKNSILSYFWDTQKLDSYNAAWDFTESALFGYAVGKVIKSFVDFQVGNRERVICHFHEWMSGTGLLYLKNELPKVGTVFTTHATVLGRSLASNAMPLYNELNRFNPKEMAYRFGVQHKHFLEQKAAKKADSFTTVSEITARECTHFLQRTPDVITPNGFDKKLFLPEEIYKTKRAEAKQKITQIAEGLSAQSFEDKPFMIAISGRNEFRNKGIDAYLDALGALNKDESFKGNILAYVLIPFQHEQPNPDLLHNLNSAEKIACEQPYSTHIIKDDFHNQILNKIREQQLFNRNNDRVKVYVCPSYLSGQDGVFNLPYYDVLSGFDFTVFPSYYEPWGYTPQESLCFGVPTLTTTLAGFGVWAQPFENPSVKVVFRDDTNYPQVVESIIKSIKQVQALPTSEYKNWQKQALDLAQKTTWEHFIQYYYDAYQQVQEKIKIRAERLPKHENDTSMYLEQAQFANKPHWRGVIVHRSTPEKLKALEVLAKNLWWCWNEQAEELFKSIDPQEWEKVEKNPIKLLDTISVSEYKALENNPEFMERLHSVYQQFLAYMERKKQMGHPSVAYFSMEYGLHSSLKIYSGGLGILAGDYLKEASDKATNITGVGLLYRYGYFTQKLSAFGDQESDYQAQDFTKIPVEPVMQSNGKWLTISLELPERTLFARVWKVQVGRVDLYLLDTDFEDNSEQDRSVTHHLYGGNWENRLKQEMLLGLGGIQMLRKLGIQTDVYHCNEGHAAFIGLERLNEFINQDDLSFCEAMEVVRSSSLFTTHTPVPAGHDFFEEGMLKAFIGNYAEKLGVRWERILSLGKINVNNPHEKFSMSILAANLSQEVNGVSWLHGEVSRDILKDMWPAYMPEELHISYVTNGVHQPTWTSPLWKQIQAKYFTKEQDNYSPESFEAIYQVPDKEIFQVKNQLRSKLIKRIKNKLSQQSSHMGYFTPREIVEIQDNLRDDILTFGFARRFATYKRAHLLFRNLEKLDAIVNNPQRPVQFIFAGKAHPADKAGQDLIKHIVEISKQPRFLGKIIFLPNYDMDLARTMIQGVDVWMNTPTRPQEASGTSGEKAAMNGVMHFSVLDGWWVEGYRPDAGWALPQERTYENQAYQDELDSELIYSIIEDQIAPAFYHRNAEGISPEWASFIKNTIAKVASKFTTYRMLTDYENQYYIPLEKRVNMLKANHFEKAIALCEWKKNVSREWERVQLENTVFPDSSRQLISLGNVYEAQITLSIGDLSPQDVGLELVASKNEGGRQKIFFTKEAELIAFEAGKVTYKLSVEAEEAGAFFLALRVFPKNPLLPHRQDFALVKWL